jgi:hypothetical protein
MANKINDTFVVNAGGGWSYLAFLTGHDGDIVTQASLTSISRSITDTRTNPPTVVPDAIVITDAVFDTAQSTPSLWDKDYTFKDDVQASKIPNRTKYLLQYTFTPVTGEVFKSREVTIQGD